MKKKPAGLIWVLVLSGCGAGAVAAILTDRYITPAADWLLIICMAGIICSLIFVWRGFSGSRLSKILLTTAGSCIMLLVIFCQIFFPYWHTVSSYIELPYTKPLDTRLTAAEVHEDISYACQALLRTHPSLRGWIPEDLAQAADTAHTAVRGKDEVTVAETARLIEAMASGLSDAHTGLELQNFAEIRYMPSSIIHQRAGHILTAVNGVSLEELLKEKEHLLSFETPAWAAQVLYNYLISDTGLAFLDIQSDPVEYTYTTAAGEEIHERISTADFVALGELYELTEKRFPLEDRSWVFYEIDEERSLAVLTLDQCMNSEEYREVLKTMFTQVRDLGIRNVAVDLRQNGGGDSSVATEFLSYLDTDNYRQIGLDLRAGPLLISFPQREQANDTKDGLVFSGNVYILTSPSTFSSAMLFTEYLTDNDLGVQIGETPGNVADGYGDVATFQLPNSGLLLGVSTKQFRRLQDEGSLLEPDIAVPSEDALEVLKTQLAAYSA